MSLRRVNPRRDGNEAVIVEALERCGFRVSRLSGAGVPDLVLSRRQLWHMAEVKSKRPTLRATQERWQDRHSAPVHVLLTVDDVLTLSGAVP